MLLEGGREGENQRREEKLGDTRYNSPSHGVVAYFVQDTISGIKQLENAVAPVLVVIVPEGQGVQAGDPVEVE